MSGGPCSFVHVCGSAAVCLSELGNRGSAHAFNQEISGFARRLYTAPPPPSLPFASLSCIKNISLCWFQERGSLAPPGGEESAREPLQLSVCNGSLSVFH